MTFKKIAFTALFCTSFLIPHVYADDVTMGDLSARLDDLEKRIRGENPAGDQLATTDDIERLTNLTKVLTGRIEVLEHQIGKKLQEKNNASGHTDEDESLNAPAEDTSASDTTDDADVNAVLASLDASAEKPKTETKATAKEKTEAKREKATEKAEKTITPTLDTGSPAAQFNQAKGLLNKGQYAAAEEAFKHYLAEYPSGKEAKAARVHLGEAQLKQGKTKEAQASFAKAYQTNSKGIEGARALLGFGESLGAGDKDKKKACTVLKKLHKDFPKNEETTGKADDLMKKYKCS